MLYFNKDVLKQMMLHLLFIINFKNMKQKTNAAIVLAVLMVFAFVACNDEKKDEPAKTDATKSETSAMPAYDPAMDPLKVEAAVISRVLGDTLNVKFYELIIKPGDTVGLHSHPDHLVYVVDGGFVELKDKDGKAQAVEFKTGMGLMTGPETHAGKNTGTTTIKLLVADIYRPRS
jgi:quercetin dioxygenase-like cupin family protein